MALDKNQTPQDDEVSSLIDAIYNDLMIMRFEYMALRKKGKKDVDALLEKIITVNDDFESLIKAHTLYLRFKKATGHGKANHSKEMIKKIYEIKANMGNIVSSVPKE